VNSDKYRYFEILAVLLTGVLKFLLMGIFDYRAFYIGLTCLFWLIYVFRRYQGDHTILRTWGFQRDNFKQSVLFLLPFAILSYSGIMVYGILNHVKILNFNVIPILFLYPVFGLVQQFMMLGLIAGNLASMRNPALKKYQIILITSVLFSLVHFPSVFLMIFTFFMELIFIITYLKWRNLWSLGLYHGITGCLLLFYVMERDLWLELWPIF
jgi:hypothetical protein